jgi:hypothetical protein
MKTLRYLIIAICLLSSHVPKAISATLLVDSFDQASYFTDNLGHFSQNVSLPLANRRSPALRGCPAPDSGAIMESRLDAGTGKLSLFVSGAPVGNHPLCPLGLSIAYNDNTIHDITGYTGFILGFSNMSGVGYMYVEVGGQDLQAQVNRINLTGAGDFFYPLDQVYENVGFTKDSFNILIFTFQATSPEFSFTLDEIRLVPEASSSALLGATLLLLGSRRTRKAGSA